MPYLPLAPRSQQLPAVPKTVEQINAEIDAAFADLTRTQRAREFEQFRQKFSPPGATTIAIGKGLVSGLAQSAWRAATTPGDVLTGKIPFNGPGATANPEMSERAAEMAGAVELGTIGRVPRGAIGSGPSRPEGIRAYHGSPHDFDQFDISRIGTGEGAQAYGHGLYFAENEGVAKQYRDTLAAQQNAATRYQFSGGIDPAYKSAAKDFLENGYGREEALVGLRDVYKNARDGELEAALQEVISGGKGRMYEVKIDASPDEFLDWDKPLSEQPGGVRKRLESAGFGKPLADNDLQAGVDRFDKYMETDDYDYSWRNVQDFRRDATKYLDAYDEGGVDAAKKWLRENPESLVARRAMPNRAAVAVHEIARDDVNTEALRAAGIKGIRYLDQGSRGAGQGTANYVVFDDKIIDILKKYGIAGLGIGGGALAATAGGTQPAEAKTPVRRISRPKSSILAEALANR